MTNVIIAILTASMWIQLLFIIFINLALQRIADALEKRGESEEQA